MVLIVEEQADSVKRVLSKWYGDSAHKLDTRAVMSQIIRALRHPDVCVYPLVADIEGEIDGNQRNKESQKWSREGDGKHW